MTIASLLRLTGVAFQSVASVAGVALLGAFARHKGWLGDETSTAVNKLIQKIFLPCLILMQVTPSMSIDNLVAIWPIAFMGLCMVTYGIISGYTICKVLKVCNPESMRNRTGLFMAMAAFPNAFSVPWTLLLAMGNNPVLLSGGQASDTELSTRVNMLFVVSYSLWLVAHWSVAFPMVKGVVSLAEWKENVLNPPLLACAFSVVVGLATNPLWSDASTGTFSNASLAAALQYTLRPISKAASLASQCSVPLTIMVLGAKLYKGVRDTMEQRKMRCPPLLQTGMSSIKPEANLPYSAYATVVLVRQVFGPVVAAAVACGVLKRLFGVKDNLVLMVGLLQSAGPPMMDLNVMASLSGIPEVETATPKVLLFTYVASIVTWTIAIAIFLHVLQHQ